MFDANTLLWILYGGIAIGFFSALLVNSIGKGIAAFGSLPAILFLIGVVSSGFKVTTTNDFGPWALTTFTGLVPVVYSGVGEAIGTTIGTMVRTAISKKH